MKSVNLAEIKKEWIELWSAARLNRKRDPAWAESAQEVLENAIELGSSMSDRVERAVLQELARSIADSIFSVTHKYPTAIIAPYGPTETGVAAAALSMSIAPDISHLAKTDYTVYGRADELSILDEAWQDPYCNVVSIVALGGTGKTALVSHWLQLLKLDSRDPWRGADAVFAWTFYPNLSGQPVQDCSDLFFHSAFRYFGLGNPRNCPDEDRGRRIAEILRTRRVLLVLDGMEFLQSPPGTRRVPTGAITDIGIRSLMSEFASGQVGLCVVTSRLPIADLSRISPQSHRQIDLMQLDEVAGAQLLRYALAPSTSTREQKRRVENTEDEVLFRTSREFGGHALTLRLLGNYLARAYKGDILCRHSVAAAFANIAGQRTPAFEFGDADHASRIISEYDDWFRERAEQNVLRMLGLFGGPADPAAIAALRGPPPIRGLTDRVTNIPDPDWNIVVSNLREAGLLTSERDDVLDCHPIVREFFRQRLKAQHRLAWRQGHERLLAFYAKRGTRSPRSLEEMNVSFKAVNHACMAGLYVEAYEIYWSRIRMAGQMCHIREFGATSSTLGVIEGFYEQPWSALRPRLSSETRHVLSTDCGICLLLLGRQDEARKPIREALRLAQRAQDWSQTAIHAWNLCWLSANNISVGDAIRNGRKALDAANKSGDSHLKWGANGFLGFALHQAGEMDSAMEHFEEGEKHLGKKGGRVFMLQPLNSFWKCELLLDRGSIAEASAALDGLPTLSEWYWEEAYTAYRDYSEGRLELRKGECDKARQLLRKAIACFRKMRRRDHLIRALIALAETEQIAGQVPEAMRSLDEAIEKADWYNMQLLKADSHLRYGLLLVDQDTECARQHCREAAGLISAVGYGRRKSELQDLQGRL